MSKGIFITATGTDVGKTYVSGLIVKKLRQHGYRAGYYKAALSGAELINGKLIAGDAEHVRQVSGLQADNLVSYVYETAVSPHLAAQIENLPIEIKKLEADFKQAKTEFDYITVEGSGGIICPLRIDDEIIMLTDIIKAFKLAVVIIAPSGLGSINSSVLTAEYAKMQDIPVKGIIMNQYEAGNFLHEDNQKQIEFLTGLPVIAHVPWGTDDLTIDAETLAAIYTEV